MEKENRFLISELCYKDIEKFSGGKLSTKQDMFVKLAKLIDEIIEDGKNNVLSYDSKIVPKHYLHRTEENTTYIKGLGYHFVSHGRYMANRSVVLFVKQDGVYVLSRIITELELSKMFDYNFIWIDYRS